MLKQGKEEKEKIRYYVMITMTTVEPGKAETCIGAVTVEFRFLFRILQHW